MHLDNCIKALKSMNLHRQVIPRTERAARGQEMTPILHVAKTRRELLIWLLLPSVADACEYIGNIQMRNVVTDGIGEMNGYDSIYRPIRDFDKSK